MRVSFPSLIPNSTSSRDIKSANGKLWKYFTYTQQAHWKRSSGYSNHCVRSFLSILSLTKTLKLGYFSRSILLSVPPSLIFIEQWLKSYSGRRYFRFFRFLNCFSKAWSCFYGSDMLGTGKWSCLGIYMVLESATIVSSCFGNSNFIYLIRKFVLERGLTL